jgi:cyclopropane-fatty-acyl-phospholipid synthase
MTLKHWQDRFAASRAEVARLYDERFCRLWEFYLAAAEMDFRYLHQMVFQLQLAKAIDAVPLTRDYLYEPFAAHTEPGRTAPSLRGTKTANISVLS